jgi:hypothetical protein
MRSRHPLYLLPILLVLAGAAAAAHITDKLVVGMYPGPLAEGQPLQLLSSGTPLEVLQRKQGFAQVRLADDRRGWVEARYVTDEKPAKAMLLETQLKLRTLNSELQALKAGAGVAHPAEGAPAPAGTVPSARQAELEQALAAAESRIGELERKALAQSQASAAQSELDTLREQVNKAARILADAQGLRLTQVESGGEKGPPERYANWIIGLVALVLGFGLGIALIDYRIRKRYGGFRI